LEKIKCIYIFVFLFLSWAVLGFELKDSYLVGKCYTTCATPPACFVLGIFEIKFSKPFAQAGFKP
jgi:hypothetical protein